MSSASRDQQLPPTPPAATTAEEGEQCDAAPPPSQALTTATSETGEAGSILFSEQIQTREHDEQEGRLREGGEDTRHMFNAEDSDGDADMDRAPAEGNMFYVEDEVLTSGTPGIVVGGDEADSQTNMAAKHQDANMDEDAAPGTPEANNFWMEYIRDPDTPGGGEDGNKETTPKAGPSRTSARRADADTRTTRSTSDHMTRVLEGRLSKEEMFVAENGEDGDEDMEEDEDYDEPESYHSGDSDEYEMDHRPWLERTAVKRDIQSLYTIKGLYNQTLRSYRYRVVDRLGEGTFSSVYLAQDVLHNLHDNKSWCEDSATDPYEPSTIKIALKKILVTSSPSRIENELSILENLRGCRHVSPLIGAFRDEDQVVIVLPYHQSDDFRYFYRLMDPPKIKQYMTCLLRGLKDIHSRGIIHRDVKPANFLFDYASGHGVLVDFGLAERYTPPRRATCQHEPATRAALHGVRTKTSETVTVEQAVYDARKRAKSGEGRIGFRQEDSRPPIKTNRAGTRGFRAPEVLLKCPDQTMAIDIWSAGIMLLSILAHKFPIFNSTDDVEGLMEIAAVFGRGAMERCAMLHNRTIMTNVPTVDNPPDSLAALILRLNPDLYTPHQPNPTPQEALEHITQIDAALDLCLRLLRLDSTTRATAAVALRHRFLGDPADDGPDELLDPTDGKCGHLHVVAADGTHKARFGDIMEEMRFGQGVPPSRDCLCPEHEHWQERSGINPLGAAFGATLDEEYYQYAGFHVLDEHVGWDDHSARDTRPLH